MQTSGFHRERSPLLILSPQHSRKAAAGVHAALGALAGCTRCTAEPGMPLVPHCGDRGARLLPLLQPLSFQTSPPPSGCMWEVVPAAADFFPLRLNLLPWATGYNAGPYTMGPCTTRGSGTHPWLEQQAGWDVCHGPEERSWGLSPAWGGSRSWSRALGGSIAAPAAELKHSPHT